ncbi:uncharacterized protein LOC119459265 [Dermacentor silvarum]|uniref:uncharacterized protein LOC119459265 n=1 Tax=Dermacentor silvarum TaxID=543639 RepID=UPI001898FA96|nr:uncharacterized protein LOC119459265 [Dermacentor silvarum]
MGDSTSLPELAPEMGDDILQGVAELRPGTPQARSSALNLLLKEASRMFPLPQASQDGTPKRLSPAFLKGAARRTRGARRIPRRHLTMTELQSPAKRDDTTPSSSSPSSSRTSSSSPADGVDSAASSSTSRPSSPFAGSSTCSPAASPLGLGGETGEDTQAPSPSSAPRGEAAADGTAGHDAADLGRPPTTPLDGEHTMAAESLPRAGVMANLPPTTRAAPPDRRLPRPPRGSPGRTAPRDSNSAASLDSCHPSPRSLSQRRADPRSAGGNPTHLLGPRPKPSAPSRVPATVSPTPEDPASCQTVLYRPTSRKAHFLATSRDAIAAFLSGVPGAHRVRANIRRNVVAVDALAGADLMALLAVRVICDVHVRAKALALNTCCGTLFAVDPAFDESTIIEGLESSAPVLSATRNGDAVVLRFAGSMVPAAVHLFRQRRVVYPRLPRPLQCGRCGLFGHATVTCHRDERCLRCAGRHPAGACTAERARCLHCGGPHAATEPSCPNWQLERRVACILDSTQPRITRRQALTIARNAAPPPASPSQRRPAESRVPERRPSAPVQPGRSFRDALTSDTGAPTTTNNSGPAQPPSTTTQDARGLVATAPTTTNNSAPAQPPSTATQDTHALVATALASALRAALHSVPADSPHSATTCQLASCTASPCADPSHPAGRSRASVYVRAGLAQAVVRVDDLPCANAECVAVTVRVGSTDTCVASVYVRAGKRWDTEFIVRLCDRVGGDLVVCGDFNSHHSAWGCARDDANGRSLLESVLRAGLFVANTGSVTFDLSLVSERCHYVWRRSPDTRGSDHFPIFLVPHAAAHLPTRSYSVVNWPRFRKLCAAVPVSEGGLFRHIAVCARAATTRCVVPAGTPVPDMKQLNLRAARRRAERKAIRTDRREHWTLYNRLDAVCRRHARQRRNASWASLCFSLDDARARSRPWRILGGILRPRVPRCPALSIAVARGITSAQLAELLAATFCPPPAVSSRPTAILQPQPHPRRELMAPQRYFPSTGILAEIDALCAADFTIGELRAVLSARKRRSAPGSDGITYQMLRNFDSGQLQLLLDAFNEVWRTGTIPSEWSEAVVVPLLKAGKPPSNPASYRPVSLTSAAGKVLEAMALRRLEWIAEALDTFAAEQSGFRRFRATADSLADVVATLEEAKHRGDASYLVLLDVVSAFDQLPHATILDALRAMGIAGRMLRYVGAFLSGRSMRRIGDYIPQLPEYEVRVAVYADDIALFAAGPTERGRAVRRCVQSALDAVDAYISGIGLTLSAAKTEALLVHPRYGARYEVPRLTLRGASLPWRRRVRYLGLLVDHRLNWQPAVAALRKGTRRVACAARSLMARGQGCSPTLALRVYNSVASARVLYGLPLADIHPSKWEALDADHRAVVRQLLCLPQSSQGAQHHRAPNFIERLHRSPHGHRLVDRFFSLPNSCMGRRVAEFAGLVNSGPSCAWLPPPPPPPHRRRRLDIRTTVPGVRGKRNTAACALRQETAAVIEEQLAGRVLVYTDGSVLRDGAASAACFAPELSAQSQCRVLHAVSSTHAELAAIDLAAKLLYQRRVARAAILTDSRAALCLLAGEDHGPTLIQRLHRKLDGVCELGCDLVFQWVPSHVGLPGNEEADRLAKEAHTLPVPRSLLVTPFDVARHTVAGYLRSWHPDPRVAAGSPPKLLPRRGLGRRDRALLLRLRIGCCRTAERVHRLSGLGSPYCDSCSGVETLDHVLLQCPAYAAERGPLLAAYRRLGIPSDSARGLLFPATHPSIAKRAYAALLEYLEDTNLCQRL